MAHAKLWPCAIFAQKKQRGELIAVKRIKILALVLTLAALLLPAHAMADDAQITVTGTGAVAYKPDTAMITLGVSEVAQGAVDAQSIVNGKIDAVKKALSEMGVAEKDIAVGDLSLWGTYDYSGEMQKLTGYMASHSLTITTTDMDAVGPLIDAALSAGANQLNGVNFSVKNNSAAYDGALALAAEKARARRSRRAGGGDRRPTGEKETADRGQGLRLQFPTSPPMSP